MSIETSISGYAKIFNLTHKRTSILVKTQLSDISEIFNKRDINKSHEIISSLELPELKRHSQMEYMQKVDGLIFPVIDFLFDKSSRKGLNAIKHFLREYDLLLFLQITEDHLTGWYKNISGYKKNLDEAKTIYHIPYNQNRLISKIITLTNLLYISYLTSDEYRDLMRTDLDVTEELFRDCGFSAMHLTMCSQRTIHRWFLPDYPNKCVKALESFYFGYNKDNTKRKWFIYFLLKTLRKDFKMSLAKAARLVSFVLYLKTGKQYKSVSLETNFFRFEKEVRKELKKHKLKDESQLISKYRLEEDLKFYSRFTIKRCVVE